MHQRLLAPLVRVVSKWLSTREGLKIPVFLLLIPIGFLLTITGMVGFTCLVIALTPFYTIQYVLWRFSTKGRIQHLEETYQWRQQEVITHGQTKRLKFSQRSDKADIQYLVKLTHNEMLKRKKKYWPYYLCRNQTPIESMLD